ncbi:PA2169 family four-helix-bundle protein [Luteimonas sp. RD2P54]|uniref:PA2169 family four-helix-bundle protein n=1 Tax=Luteimonas endophytica TaxID=3042023 RepID=A0ABT6JCM2_9GAMM|nr:PA2169 family four-helix-bundle protein [Luteimonas endophytica]MDH5823928.1 PA2169 family four-helix-bundle protein [Luteimonas endophytica]
MTNTTKKTTHSLNDLIGVTRDGREFYEEAAQKVQDPDLKALFTRLAGVKAAIVNELGGAVQAAGGTPEDSGTMAGGMRQMYAKLRAGLGDKEYSYVAELEESEDRLLEAFRETAADNDTPAAARDIVTRLLPEVQACHDVMRDRKLAMKRAA